MSRLYRVAVKGDPASKGDKSKPVERLIRAISQGQATTFVTKNMVTCEVAEVEDVHRLAKAGVEIEDAMEKAGVQ